MGSLYLLIDFFQLDYLLLHPLLHVDTCILPSSCKRILKITTREPYHTL